MVLQVLHIILLILYIYLAVNISYLLLVAVFGRLRKNPGYGPNPQLKRIAVLIPAYKEDSIIVQTARAARRHDYPRELFEVFVAADHLQPETIEKLNTLSVEVIQLQFEHSSKARSLNRILNLIPEKSFDIALILDADNVMMPGCLHKINDAFQKGFRAVQCHRVAKNRNTPVAVLDALSEEINNNLFRQGQRAIGMSSAATGSGMAFEFSAIRQVYNKPDILSNPACDREVDFEMMKSDTCIEFIPDALVLDEKVPNALIFEKQRTRWLESQAFHLRLFFSAQRPARKTKDFWNKLFLNLMPPRLILVIIFLTVLALYLLHFAVGQRLLHPPPFYWMLLALGLLTAFLVSIPGRLYSLRSLRALLFIPALMWSMLRALLHMKMGRKEFLHTPKTFTHQEGT